MTRFQGQYDSDSNQQCEDLREVAKTAFKARDPETILFVQIPATSIAAIRLLAVPF